MVMERSGSRFGGLSPAGDSHSLVASMARSTTIPMSPNIYTPMLEVNVKKYNLLTKDSAERSLSPENCCTYCEKHHEGVMTESKKFHIEEWRQNVHKSRKVLEKPKSPKKKRIKLRFLKPGVEEEPGFRRVRTPKEMRSAGYANKRRNDWSVNVMALSSDFNRISVESFSSRTEMLRSRMPGSAGPAISVSTIPNQSGTKSNMSAKNDVNAGNSRAQSSAANVITSESLQSEFKRSCSNTLLNCLTIDDYKARYGSSYSKVGALFDSDIPSHVKNTTISENSVVEIEGDNNEEKDEKTSPRSDQSKTSDQSNKSKISDSSAKSKQSDTSAANKSKMNGTISVKFASPPISEHAPEAASNATLESIKEEDIDISVENRSEAVRKAFEALLPDDIDGKSNEMMHRHQNICQTHLQKGKTSKRFQRLHRNLHQWMEEEILQPRYFKETSDMSGHAGSRNTSTVSSPTASFHGDMIHSKQNGYNNRKTGKPKSLKKKSVNHKNNIPDNKYRNYSVNGDDAQVSESVDKASGNNLLEMLMEMDSEHQTDDNQS